MKELWCVYITEGVDGYDYWRDGLCGNLKFVSTEKVDTVFQKAKEEVDKLIEGFIQHCDWEEQIEVRDDLYSRWINYPNGGLYVVYTARKVKITDGTELDIL